MANINCSISFFVENTNEEYANEIFEKIEDVSDLCDMYDDGEDFCINCEITINVKGKPNYDAVDKKLTKLIANACENNEPCWDYHYMKGLDCDFYYQP